MMINRGQNYSLQDRVAMAICGCATFYGAYFGLSELKSQLFVAASVTLLAAVTFCGLGALILAKRGNAGTYRVIVIAACVLFAYLFVSGGQNGSGIFWSILVPIASPFFLGFRNGLMISAAYLAIVTVGLNLPSEQIPGLHQYPTAIGARLISVYSVSAIISLVYEYNRQTDKEKLIREVVAREENENRFRQVFVDSPDAYVVIHDGVIHACNRASEAMMRGEIQGMSIESLSAQHQPDGRRSKDAIAEIVASATRLGRARFEWVHRRLDGEEFCTEVSISVTTMLNRSVLLTSWRDIGERKRAEQKLAQINEELERGNRLMSAREDRIMELKREVNHLSRELGHESVYRSVEDQLAKS